MNLQNQRFVVLYQRTKERMGEQKMEELLFAANTVLPLLILMSLGLLCRKVGLLNDGLVSGINQLIFKVFLPVNLCYNVLTTPYDTEISGTAFLLIPLGLVALFGVLTIVVPLVEKDKKKVGVIIQGIGRSNYAFFGIPLVAMLFPGQDTSLASLMVMATVPFYNILSVIALSIFCGSEVKIKKILLNILKNPLIIGSVLGYGLWLLRFQLPQFLLTSMNNLSKLATPLALFTLGGAIHFASAKAHRKQLLIGVIGKLVISPLIFLPIAVALGLRGVALAVVFVAFGAPTAVASFPMAQQMGGDGKLAAEQVALTSAFSILSTFVFVFALKSLALI